jgi:hypothetical protein
VAAFCWLALEWSGLEIETLTRRWRELSACWAVMMLRISFSWRYTLSTPSAKGVGKVSKSVAVMTTFWLALAKAGRYVPSRLMAATTSLARAQMFMWSTNKARSALSADLRWCSSVIWASKAARSTMSSPRCCLTLCSTSACRAWAHTYSSS